MLHSSHGVLRFTEASWKTMALLTLHWQACVSDFLLLDRQGVSCFASSGTAADNDALLRQGWHDKPTSEHSKVGLGVRLVIILRITPSMRCVTFLALSERAKSLMLETRAWRAMCPFVSQQSMHRMTCIFANFQKFLPLCSGSSI